MSVSNKENLQTYTPIPDGVRIERSIKEFDLNGRPTLLFKDYSNYRRTAAWVTPANKSEIEKDLATFLKRYGQQ